MASEIKPQRFVVQENEVEDFERKVTVRETGENKVIESYYSINGVLFS